MPDQEGVHTPDDGEIIVSLNATLTAIVSQILATKTVKRPATLTELNGMTGGSYPNGIMAVVTTADGGLEEGSIWARVDGHWNLVAGARVVENATFVASLAAMTNLRTAAGTSYFDSSNGEIGVWIDENGTTRILVDQTWTHIDNAAGVIDPSAGYFPAYKLVAGYAGLRGRLQKGTGNFSVDDVVMVLDAESRPGARVTLMAPGIDGTIGIFRFDDDGVVTLTSTIGGESDWYSLDGLHVPHLNT